jgi:phage terminase large subunit
MKKNLQQKNEVEFFIHKKIIKAYEKDKRYTVLYGGRGGGKSMQVGGLVIMYSLLNPDARILCVRGTQNKISESSLKVLKDVISLMKVDSFFESTENTLKRKNGGEFLFYGAKNYHTFKSLQGIDLCWVDEATELSEAAWDVLIPTIRNEKSKFLITFNPEFEKDWVYENFIVGSNDGSVVEKLNWNDNPFFPKVLDNERKRLKKKDYNKYLHIWEGELITKRQGALWDIDYFQLTKDKKIDGFDEVVVALDPSGKRSKYADEAGIIVAGRKGSFAYVLEDGSGKYTPKQQAEKVINLYYKYNADKIIIEKNGVGAGFKTILKGLDESVIIKEIHSSRSKIARAEPVSYLYEERRVYHTKRYTELEYELLNYTPDTTKSPNRLDSLVFAITELLIKKKKVNKNEAIDDGRNLSWL